MSQTKLDTSDEFIQGLEQAFNLLSQLINGSQYSQLMNNPDYNPKATLEDAEEIVQHALDVYCDRV